MIHPKISYFDVTHDWMDAGRDILICGLALDDKIPPTTVCHGNKRSSPWPWLIVFFDGEARLNPGMPEETDCTGSLMIWPPGTIHCYGNTKKEWKHSWLIVDFPEMDVLLKNWPLPVGKPLKIDTGRIFAKYLPLFQEELNSPGTSSFYLSSLMRLFLFDLHRLCKRKTVAIPPRIQEIAMFLEGHIQDEISAEALASRCGISIPHLTALFKRYYHSAPMKYLNDKRMIHASKLLTCYPYSCKEIANFCGFRDPLYFSRCFHQYWGISPREFRKRKEFPSAR